MFQRMQQTKVLLCTNNKGGVSKTSTTLNLAAALSEMGKTCLIIDMDESTNATKHLKKRDSKEKCFPLSSLLASPQLPLEDCLLWNLTLENCALIPGDDRLKQTVEEIVGGNENNLVKLAEHFANKLADFDGEVDFILIDHSPSVDSSVKIALSAATHIIINADASSYSEEGIHNLLRGDQMKIVRKINPDMKVLGVLFTMVHERSVVGRAVVSEKTCAGYPVLPLYIPFRVEISENTHFQRFCVHNKLSKLAPYFRELATYVVEQTSNVSEKSEQGVA